MRGRAVGKQLICSLPIPEFYRNSPITFWLILLANKRTNKTVSCQRTDIMMPGWKLSIKMPTYVCSISPSCFWPKSPTTHLETCMHNNRRFNCFDADSLGHTARARRAVKKNTCQSRPFVGRRRSALGVRVCLAYLQLCACAMHQQQLLLAEQLQIMNSVGDAWIHRRLLETID